MNSGRKIWWTEPTVRLGFLRPVGIRTENRPDSRDCSALEESRATEVKEIPGRNGEILTLVCR